MAFSHTPRALDRFEYAQVHMGMPVRVVVHAATREQAERAARDTFARVAELDAILSDYRPDSELNRLSATSGVWTPIGADLFAVLARALEIAEASGGAFDPTIGPLTRLWRESRHTRTLPEDRALVEARGRVSWRYLKLDPAKRAAWLDRGGMRLDLGGIAKGYILQAAMAVLVTSGTPQALAEAGGDIVVGDAPPGKEGWRIDVPHADAAFARSTVALARVAVSTSGATAQSVDINGVRYSHVVDPWTGLGVTHDRVTSVIARDGATADALATAANVLGPERARRLLAAFPGVTATFRRANHTTVTVTNVIDHLFDRGVGHAATRR